MNKKITFPELIDLVSQSNGTTKKTSESFVKEFFAAIEQALEDGETVKIRRFGVFKVSKVEARKSVHVGTGEEIEIPEHSKITFTPDKELADAVNAAFADFDTVEIDDNTPSEVIEALEDTSADEELPISAPIAAITVEETTAEEPEAQSEEITEPAMPPEIPVELMAQDEEAEEPEVEEEPEAAVVTVMPMTEPEPQAEEPAEYNYDDEEEDDNAQKGSFGKGFFWGLITGIIVTALLLLAILWFSGFGVATSTTDNEDDEAQVENVAVTDSLEPEFSAAEAKPADTATKQPEAAKEEAKPASDNSISLVKTDTVGRTRFLTTMAREYYGDLNFWVYIYEENKSIISDPNHIEAGTVVIIPPASKYGIDKNDPESVAKAKAKSAEILGTK